MRPNERLKEIRWMGLVGILLIPFVQIQEFSVAPKSSGTLKHSFLKKAQAKPPQLKTTTAELNAKQP
ncbi:MAG: hypothetical protein ACO3A2_09760 [Bdellovibrionia bacterium]